MKRLGITLLAAALCGHCQCEHQEIAVVEPTNLKPEYQPPHRPIATALDEEAEEARRAEVRQDEVADGVFSFIVKGLFPAGSAALFGTETDEDKREKCWRKSRKRKIPV